LATSGDGINLDSTTKTIRLKDMNPAGSQVFETLTEFVSRRTSNGDRITRLDSFGDLCANKNTNIFSINHPNSPTYDGRSSQIAAYLFYPSTITISGLWDQLKIGQGALAGEFPDKIPYIGYTGANVRGALGSNTVPSTFEPIQISGVNYRMLVLGDGNVNMGTTGNYKVYTCS
jgi:hypothetical protein